MASKRYTVRYRRKRKNKTNYSKRLKLLASGQIRFVVRFSLKNVVAQFVEYVPEGDKTLVLANSRELLKFNWNYSRSNMAAAYLVGYLCGLKAKKAGIKKAIFDTGLQIVIHKSSLFAALKGCLDAGLEIPCDKKTLPSEDVVSGKRIEEYAKLLLSKDKALYDKQFSSYLKNKVKPEEIVNIFNKTKGEIVKKWQE